VDVSKNPKSIEEAFLKAEEAAGPVFMLINCAGQAVCGKIEDLTEDEFKVGSLSFRITNHYLLVSSVESQNVDR
jgi:short-subunit dehydrogenase